MLADLDKLDASESRFEELLGTFTGAAREHIAFEETRVWPGLRSALPAQVADELGTKIADGKKTAPTRPHPHTPAAPSVLKTAGPAVAAADKARDAATGRDRPTGRADREDTPMTIMAGRATNWRASGACLHADPDLFFRISAAGRALSQIAQAKAICASCPSSVNARSSLRQHADAGRVSGATPEERQKARRVSTHHLRDHEE